MLLKDIRFAMRLLSRNPGFTALAVFVLAVGIGANTVIFSIVNAVLLRPLPYKNPERLVLFWESLPRLGPIPLSQGSFSDWREHNGVFSEMTGFKGQWMVLTGKGSADRLSAMAVSANLFSLLGGSPLIGRAFSPAEDQPGAEPVVLLSHGIWQRRFGSDRQVVGQSLTLEGTPHTIIGVFGNDFLFPPPLDDQGIREFQPEIYVPLTLRPDSYGARGTYAVARLEASFSIEDAQKQLGLVADGLIDKDPENYPPDLGVLVAPLHEQGVSRSRPTLLILVGAVALILLIACFNVANLILARALGRFKEIAIRVSLGAGPGRIVGQILTESLLIALLGGAIGVVLALFSLRLVVEVGTGHIPLIATVAIDSKVLAFTILVTSLTGILFGLIPALQAYKPELSEALKESFRGSSSGKGRQKLRSAILVAEVALAVVLLVGAGMFLKSFFRLQQVDPGFDPDNNYVFRMRFPENERYKEWRQVRDMVRQTMEEVGSLPGVEHVGAISTPPLSGGSRRGTFEIAGRLAATPDDKAQRVADFRRTTPGYFAAMKIRSLEGRIYSDSDLHDSPLVCLVNRALAEKFWPAGSPLGASLTRDDPTNPDAGWAQVIGVVDNVKHSGLESAPEAAIYCPLDQWPSDAVSVIVRSQLDAPALSEAIRQRLSRLDPDIPVTLRPYTYYLSEAQAGRRSPAVLMGIFASLALVLALGGLYGVVSYLVEQRGREIGVRLALGANKVDIIRLIGSQTAALVLTGLAIGLIGAYASLRFLGSLLFGVSPGDPWTFLGVTLLFALVSGLACYVPVRRACRVDPLTALRAE